MTSSKSATARCSCVLTPQTSKSPKGGIRVEDEDGAILNLAIRLRQRRQRDIAFVDHLTSPMEYSGSSSP